MKRGASLKIIGQWSIRESLKVDIDYVVLYLEDELPNQVIRKYEIDGVIYDIVRVSDIPKAIAINGSGNYVGKTVCFLTE